MIVPIIINENQGLKDGEYLYEKDGKWRKGYDYSDRYSIFDELTGYHVSRVFTVLFFVMWLVIDYLMPYTKTVKLSHGFIQMFIFIIGYFIFMLTPTLIIVLGFKFIDKYIIKSE